MWAILNKYNEPVGIARTQEEILKLCMIEMETRITEKEVTEDYIPQYPRNLHVVANKKYTIGTWFEQEYALKDERSSWAWVNGLTENAARERAMQDIIAKLKKTYTILPVDTRQHRTAGE